MVVSPSKIPRKPSSRKVTIPKFDGFLADDHRRRAFVDQQTNGLGGDKQLKMPRRPL
jgi:hypothetical protein